MGYLRKPRGCPQAARLPQRSSTSFGGAKYKIHRRNFLHVQQRWRVVFLSYYFLIPLLPPTEMSVAAALQALVDCQVSSNNILLLSRVALVADVSDMTGQRHHTAAQRT